MSSVQIAMLGNLRYAALRDAILTHPTLTEGLVILFMSAPTVVNPLRREEQAAPGGNQ